MLIEIDFNSDEAIYVQLCNQIIMGIATEQLKVGETLPSVRQLADTIGINMHTVNKAYSVLRQEGFLSIDRRRGAVISIDVDKIRALEEMKENLLPVLAKGCCKNITREEVHALIDEIFEEYTDIIYIDAANEFSTGEVVVGIKNNQAVIAPDRAFYFPEVLEDSKSVLEMSCTELNNVKPQHLVTNLVAANICLIQTIKILSGDWTCGGIYSFDAFGCSCTRTDPNLIKQQQKGKLK